MAGTNYGMGRNKNRYASLAEVRGLCKEVVGQYGWTEKEKSPMNVKLKNIISSLHLLIVVIYLLILYNWFNE